MNVIGMMLVKNEEKRWLTETLVNMREICNKIIVLDDCSDDNTVEICERLGCYVIKNNESLWSTDELKARKRLFNIVTNEFAHGGDWLLCLDADEIFVYDHLDYIKYIFHTTTKQINGIAFRLYDMWSDTYYREDVYWKAHHSFWPMAIRYKEGFNYEWSEKPLHCGRFPCNSAPNTMPTMIPIKHMGWSTEEDRQKKYDRYMSIDPLGRNGWLEQYKSILDESPNLVEFYRG